MRARAACAQGGKRTEEHANVRERVMRVIEVERCPDGAGCKAQLLGVEVCRRERVVSLRAIVYEPSRPRGDSLDCPYP